MRYQQYNKVFLFLSCFVVLIFSCHHPRQVNNSFYYWKTVYKANKTEGDYLHHLHVHKLYVRIMDVDMAEDGTGPVPVSPITFKNKLPDSLQIVPVVFIVNDILKMLTQPQLNDLANKIILFTTAKVQQSGKNSFNELQIDCDWTATTRDNYFYLLRQLKSNPKFSHKIISVTLRLHQLKNQKASGIPPAGRVMLMCYNMGNLRKYGEQNSILEISELKKYLGSNIAQYPLPVDIGLPLFQWAVVFRNKEYAGLSKRIKFIDLMNKNQFIFIRNNIYKTAQNLPEYGLNKADEIRWEDISMPQLLATASYLSSLLKTDTVNLIYFHLDETALKTYTFNNLETVNNLLH